MIERGGIYFVSLDPTSGHEQRGTRPVMVVSPAAFNQVTQVPIVCPITNKGGFARTRGFAVELVGTTTTGVVRCDQPRVLDVVARGGRLVWSCPRLTGHLDGLLGADELAWRAHPEP